jgi:hypothetical protein
VRDIVFVKRSIPPDMALPNQRRYPRAKLSLKVEWGGTPVCHNDGCVTSLGVGGCFIQTGSQLPERSVVFIRLMLAPESVSILDGLVMGSVIYNLEGKGFAVEFMTLKVGYEKEIHDLVGFYLDASAVN